MKKIARSVLSIALIALSGSAFAQLYIGNPALETVISNTDAQLAPAMNSAISQYQAVTLPAPYVSRAAAGVIQLTDITEKCTQQGEVVSAYPWIYKMFNSEENSRILKVFRFIDPKGNERRVEVYFTGGDWMKYGLTYFVTNAGRNKDQVNAYFMSDLSTSDRESGAVAPKINPFDFPKLASYIVSDFLDTTGNVKPVFSSIAAASALAK
ncbi:MAG TPA: hypothetical protein DCL44_08285 [Elusimicrobia bacterium]|nr:hypothetical protein [Elusimicrobiota bacterium]